MNRTQIAVISGSIILIVLLLFANTTPPKNKAPEAESGHANHAGASMELMLGTAKAALSPENRTRMDALEKALVASANKKKAFEDMIGMWDSLRQPAAAAYYMEEAAKVSPVAQNWMDAGNRYYSATRFAAKEEDRHVLFDKAIECYNRSLEIDPSNVDAKISLGACYVEGTSEPMKGIGILKEVEKTDSNNINLQLNFAFFSERSGQWDKAIARFEKVLKIKPDFTDAYLHLADAYVQMGDNKKAISYLEKYIALEPDVTIKAEVKDYINKLQTN